MVEVVAAQQCADTGEEFAGGEGFDEVVVGAGVEAIDAVFDLAFGGEHEDGGALSEAAQFGGDVVAAAPGHHDVEQDQVGLVLEGALQAGLAVGGGERAVPLVSERVAERGAHRALVFDDEDSLAGSAHDEDGWWIGSSRVKRLPSPGRLSTLMLPPCASAVWRTMARPMPTPCVSRSSSLPMR